MKNYYGHSEWRMGALPAGVTSKAFMGKCSSPELCRMSGIWTRDSSASVSQWPQMFQMYCRKYSNAVGYRVGLILGAVGKSDGKKTIELCSVVGSHPRDHPIQGDRSALISRVNWGLLDMTTRMFWSSLVLSGKKPETDERWTTRAQQGRVGAWMPLSWHLWSCPITSRPVQGNYGP